MRSKSPAHGATSTGPSTSAARSSTYSSPPDAISEPHDDSPARRSAPMVSRSRSSPTGPRHCELRAAIEGLVPAAFHNTTQYANNRVECDHGRIKARLRPMRGLKRDHSARVIIRGHALCRTSVAGTTNSASTRATTDVSRPRSPTSPARSEPGTGQEIGSPRPDPNQRNSAAPPTVTLTHHEAPSVTTKQRSVPLQQLLGSTQNPRNFDCDRCDAADPHR